MATISTGSVSRGTKFTQRASLLAKRHEQGFWEEVGMLSLMT